jgi:TctA family transporter
MPLFLLGLPLTGSEALFYDLMSIKGFTFNNAIDVDFFFNVIVYNMILINILAFLVAWPFAKYISFIYKIPLKLISIFVFVCLLYVMWLVGGNSLQSWYYVQVFFVLLPLGYLLRKFDLIPLVFVFILQDKLYFTFLTSKDLLLTLF